MPSFDTAVDAATTTKKTGCCCGTRVVFSVVSTSSPLAWRTPRLPPSDRLAGSNGLAYGRLGAGASWAWLSVHRAFAPFAVRLDDRHPPGDNDLIGAVGLVRRPSRSQPGRAGSHGRLAARCGNGRARPLGRDPAGCGMRAANLVRVRPTALTFMDSPELRKPDPPVPQAGRDLLHAAP